MQRLAMSRSIYIIEMLAYFETALENKEASIVEFILPQKGFSFTGDGEMQIRIMYFLMKLSPWIS